MTSVYMNVTTSFLERTSINNTGGLSFSWDKMAVGRLDLGTLPCYHNDSPPAWVKVGSGCVAGVAEEGVVHKDR
jgi:hypothetical protein